MLTPSPVPARRRAAHRSCDLLRWARDRWEAEIPAAEMRKIHYTAGELKDGGYTAQQMKNSQAYSLDELKEGRYKPLELGEAGYLIPALRAAKFSALDLRKALIFNVQMMRDAGYTAPEMKKARPRRATTTPDDDATQSPVHTPCGAARLLLSS